MNRKQIFAISLLLSGISISAAQTPVNHKTSKTVSVPMTKIKTPSGLQYEIIVEGTGKEVQSGDVATVHYTGWLTDATGAADKSKKFDSSHDRNDPFSFSVGGGQVIRGWDEGVKGMKVGEKRILTIPSNLGYGASGAGRIIPGNATLVFEVELLAIKSK